MKYVKLQIPLKDYATIRTLLMELPAKEVHDLLNNLDAQIAIQIQQEKENSK